MRSLSASTVAVALAALLAACGSARELEEQSSTAACARCHGFPPPPFTMGHPADANCVECHADTVDANNDLLPGGAHANGRIDTTGHPLPYVDQHAAAALAAIGSCTLCHGADYGGGVARSCTGCHDTDIGFADWKTNCTFCHGSRTPGWNGAPVEAAAPATGAHAIHLTGGIYAGPLPCASCHAVPAQTFPESLEHVDGRVTIEFSPVAAQGVANPAYANGTCAVYCHGSTFLLGGGANPKPAWTSTGLACGACHTTAPTSGLHGFHLAGGVPCASCHPGYVAGASPTVNPAVHVNGTFEADPITIGTTLSAWPAGCATCHPGGVPPIP